MASPPTKKMGIEVKLESESDEGPATGQMPAPSPSREIILITLPGVLPDAQIFCFNKEFRLSSALFKIHFPHLGALMIDVPASQSSRPASRPYKHCLVSYQSKKMATWFFRAHDGTVTHTGTIIGRAGDNFHSNGVAELGFYNLLCAAHNKKITLRSCEDIIVLGRYRNAFGGLAPASNALDAALSKNPDLAASIASNHQRLENLLTAACRFRHKDLFHDCLIFLLGPWSDPQYKKLTDPTLRKLAETAYDKHRERVANFHIEIASYVIEPVQHGCMDLISQMRRVSRDYEAVTGPDGKIILPAFARRCSLIARRGNIISRTRSCFDDMARTDLILDKSGRVATGCGDHQDYFLSIDIDEYPWDDKEWA